MVIQITTIFYYIVYVGYVYKWPDIYILLKIERGETESMLSRDCDGCSQLKSCKKRYGKVTKGEKVYCPDGTVHLVDEEYHCFIQEPYIEVKKIC